MDDIARAGGGELPRHTIGKLGRVRWLGLFFGLSLAFLLVGYWNYRSELAKHQQQAYSALSTIAELKTGQIVVWREGRIQDVVRLAKSSPVVAAVTELRRDPGAASARELLAGLLKLEAEEQHVNAALIIGPDGLPLVAYPEDSKAQAEASRATIAAALVGRSPVLSDLYQMSNGEIRINAAAPVLDGAGTAIAVLLLRDKPSETLYPLVESWPTPSPSAETLLVRRSGDEVLFLNDLRHEPNTAFSLRQPLSDTDVPAVQAVLGKTGVFDGVDYRGVPVLADLRPVPNSPWFLITKIDQGEIAANALEGARIGVLLALLGILIAALVTGFAYRQQQVRLYRHAFRVERGLRETQGEYRVALYSIGDAVITTDVESRIRQMNPVAEQLTGWTEAEAAGQPVETVFRIVNEETRAACENPAERVLREGKVVGLANHTLLLAHDGTERPIADSGAPIRDEQGQISGVVLVFRDQSEERASSKALQASEERLRLALKAAGQGLYDLNVQTGEAVVGPEYARMLGYDPDGFVESYERWRERLHPEDLHPVLEAYKDYLEGRREDYRGEFRQRTRDGAWKWILSMGEVATRDEQGRPLRMLGTHTDITARKKAEEDIQKLNRALAILGGINQEIVRQHDQRRLFEAACQITVERGGFLMAWVGVLEPGTNRVDPVAQAGHAEDYVESLDIRLNDETRASGPTVMALKTGKCVVCSDIEHDPCMAPWRDKALRLGYHSSAAFPLCVDGAVRGTFNLYARDPDFFGDEEITLFEELAADLSFAMEHFEGETRRQQAEDALRESEIRFRVTFEQAAVGIALIGLDGRWTRVNQKLCDIVGYTREELLEKTFQELTHPDDLEASLVNVRQALSGKLKTYFIEKRYLHKNGNTVWINATSSLVRDDHGTPQYFIAVIENIGARKRAEEALRASEARFRTLIENAPDAIVVQTDLRFAYINRAGAELLGAETAERLLGTPVLDRYSPEAREAVGKRLRLLNEERQTVPVRQDVVLKLNGEPFEVEVSAVPFHFDGKDGSLAFVRDLTSRRQVEAELRLRLAALNAAANSIMITDRNGMIEWANAAFTKFTGYTLEEAVGRNPRELVKSGVHDAGYYQAMWTTILAGDTWTGEIVNRRKDGSLYTEEMTITPLKDERGEISHFIAIKRDISEHKTMEAQLRQEQKMGAVGRLAGGVAHDFNNMLSVILGNVEMLLEDLNPSDPMYSALIEIEKASSRSAALTRQLLAFARKQTIDPKLLNLNETIEDMLKMLRRLIGEDITLMWQPGGNLWSVRMDPAQIDQILANLAVNARDAIGGVGKMIIATANVALDESYCEHHEGFIPGQYIHLTVSDTGCGMDARTLDQVFEPFFTTKPMGQGTGLGLSTVYGIVRQNNGLVNVYSEPGQGTTFSVYLPRCLVEAEDAGNGLKPTDLPAGTEVVLLVEDELALLELSRRMLSSLGYRVLATGSAREAVRMAAGFQEDIPLLITDVIMPEMSGRDLWSTLAGKRPGLKCLFISGYTADIIAHHGVLEGGVHFLSKPFSKQDLAKKVREVLSAG